MNNQDDDDRYVFGRQDQQDAALKERDQLRDELEKYRGLAKSLEGQLRSANDLVESTDTQLRAELDAAKRREVALIERCKDVFENIASDVYGLSECHCDHTRGVTDCAYCASERFIDWWRTQSDTAPDLLTREQVRPLVEALSDLLDAACSFHDYNIHGDCCRTCSDLTDAVERAKKAIDRAKSLGL